MGLSQEAHDAGQEVASAAGATLPETLNRVLERFLGWPYRVTSACVVDQDGTRTERFVSVAYVTSEGAAAPESTAIPADAVAAVIDSCESLNLDGFRAAYSRIAQAKRLRKGAAPHPGVPWSTTVTLGIIFALRSELPFDDLAEELNRLNAGKPGGEWPNMVVVASTGVIDYAVQFPGESLSADFLIPAEGEITGPAPPMYIVVVMRPTGTHTFNKMLASLVAHLAIFFPGAKVPNFTQILEGVPQQVMVISGYQYNLSGELFPVPRQFYNDHYLPPLPWRIEDQRRNLLSTLQFLPWQDGGVILLRGKLPLDGLLLFLGGEALGRAKIFPRPEAQISSILPITRTDFMGMLSRVQAQSNMVVRPNRTKLVLKKIADEGSRSPFMARLFMGILRLRNAVYPGPAEREKFDRSHELIISALMNARASAQDIAQLWAVHIRKVTSGEIVRLKGTTIHIGEGIDQELRKQVEGFLNTAVRALKQGMQKLAADLHVEIGFLFQKQAAFAAGLTIIEATDPSLAGYLRQARLWSERLLESRNAIEHEGWALPSVTYAHAGGGIQAGEPSISGQPVSQFVTFILDRLLCFVEEVTVHCLQRQLPTEITVTEIPVAQRLAEMPQRFELTLARGGRSMWQIAYHGSSFEDT